MSQSVSNVQQVTRLPYTFRSLLSIPIYRRLLISTALWQQLLAMWTLTAGWLLLELTDSALAVVMLSFWRRAAQLSVGFFAGPIGDRFGRRTTMLHYAVVESVGLCTDLAALLDGLVGGLTHTGYHVCDWHLMDGGYASSHCIDIRSGWNRQNHRPDVSGKLHARAAGWTRSFCRRLVSGELWTSRGLWSTYDRDWPPYYIAN